MGATGGIGRRVCRLIGERRGEVVVVGRDAAALARIDEEVNESVAGCTRRFVADFASIASTRACASAIEHSECPLDGAVVIVPSVPKSPDDLPGDDDWRAALDLCFVNPLAVLRSGLRNVIEGGRVVIVSGIASVEVFPELPFSNVVRLAWLAENKRLSFVLASSGIRVNTVSLGGTVTERFAARLANRSAHDVPSRESPENIPLREYGDPDDAAYVVVSLLSRLSNHITGANIVFDGGLTRSY
jgi:3-oxoacyl-[acyl-carrier protein] reductase